MNKTKIDLNMKEKFTNPFLFKKRGVVCGERISTSLTLKKNKYLSLGESVSVSLLIKKNRIIIHNYTKMFSNI